MRRMALLTRFGSRAWCMSESDRGGLRPRYPWKVSWQSASKEDCWNDLRLWVAPARGPHLVGPRGHGVDAPGSTERERPTGEG